MALQTEDDVSSWTVKQVSQWLEAEGFPDYVPLLCDQHRLDGPSLLSLRETDLRTPPMQMTVLGDIKRLMLAVNRLQSRIPSAMPEPWTTHSDGAAVLGATMECNGRHKHRAACEDTVASRLQVPCQANGHHYHNTSAERWHPYSSGKCRDAQLDPEYWKTALSVVYFVFVCGATACVMVIVHERVPDMRTYPPLPDIFLDSVPRIPWAFAMAEVCGLTLGTMWILVLLLHKHRSILFRRLCSLMGTVFLLRCVTMLITSLSVPGVHLQCSAKEYLDSWGKIQRALTIWSGLGMTLTGVHTCGDYMFSGHTVVLTMLNFFITEYTPRGWYFIHTASWVLNLFGIFFILAAHEHYSIDVFVAFYLTTRLFLYYHTLSNTRVYQRSRRARVWFPLFSFFECNVSGPVPNRYCWPFPRPHLLKIITG
ncbi:sphingomyelin synthase-related protein 1-like isoform X1 [Alosa alosa]|nr:sphingomyelin synthase-related protein 1-like isoform X1 [Alosa alosa]XP_048123237.1 sphingomyelin synthase-related protein 1-like isoform X1 [Alosa alosa]